MLSLCSPVTVKLWDHHVVSFTKPTIVVQPTIPKVRHFTVSKASHYPKCHLCGFFAVRYHRLPHGWACSSKISEHIGNTKTALWHTFRPSTYTTYHPSHGNNNPGAVRDVSPFQNTMAYVRWNTDAHPERMPTLKRYEPFFHTLHFSMPKYVPDKEESFVNLTHDNH